MSSSPALSQANSPERPPGSGGEIRPEDRPRPRPRAVREPRCPSCSEVLPPAAGNPHFEAFAGNSHLAPLLVEVWSFTREVLAAIEKPVPLLALCEVVGDSVGASPLTVRALLDSARKEGVVEVVYRRGGTPVRRRAFVLPLSSSVSDPQPDQAAFSPDTES